MDIKDIECNPFGIYSDAGNYELALSLMYTKIIAFDSNNTSEYDNESFRNGVLVLEDLLKLEDDSNSIDDTSKILEKHLSKLKGRNRSLSIAFGRCDENYYVISIKQYRNSGYTIEVAKLNRKYYVKGFIKVKEVFHFLDSILFENQELVIKVVVQYKDKLLPFEVGFIQRENKIEAV